MPPHPLLSLRSITKTYPAVVANDGVDLDVLSGQIHAVLGENGAGKSTLMKIIYGAVQPDAGQMLWRGQPVQVRSPAHARSLGIGMVFQHFSLFETLTVVENVSLAVRGSRRELARRIVEIGERFGLPVDPRAEVHTLSMGERQRVEIIRCLLAEPALLIMDEPTSVLPPQGVAQLFDTLRQLAAAGVSIVYISHKLEELRQLCDTATVLRQGRVTGRVDPRRESTGSLARLMIGRELPRSSDADASAISAADLLRVNGVSSPPAEPFGVSLQNVSLTVRAGEIVAIAGVSGNGQNELIALLSGETRCAERPEAIELCGSAAGSFDPDRRRRLGLSFVPEDRLGRGAVGALSLADNALLTGHRHGLSKFGWRRFGAMAGFADDCIADNDVRCGGSEAEARSLSGGNLQKFIVGRELALQPKLLIVSQPTWGVDVGAAAAIRRRMIELRNSGAGILIVSEELEELFEVSDRICVMFDGRLSPALPTRDTSVARIGEWMTGAFP